MPLCGPGKLWRESAENTGSCSPPNLAWGRSRASGQSVEAVGQDRLPCKQMRLTWGQLQFCAPADLQGSELLFPGCLLGGGSETSTGTACKNAGCQAVSCHWAAWLLTSPLDLIKSPALAGRETACLPSAGPCWSRRGREGSAGPKEPGALGSSRTASSCPLSILPFSCPPPLSDFPGGGQQDGDLPVPPRGARLP